MLFETMLQVDGTDTTVTLLEQINFLGILAVLAFTWTMNRFWRWIIPWLANTTPPRFRLHLLPLLPVLQLLTVVFAVMAIVPQIIEPSPENLLAAFTVSALAIGFAFQDYVSSLIAGVVAIYEQPYRVGDWVQIDDAYGEVKSLGFRAMQMVTMDDTLVTVPHKVMWNKMIFNNNDSQRDHLCVTDFYLHPDHNAVEVQQLLRDVALTSPYLQLERPLNVTMVEQPWGSHYRIKAYPIDGRDQAHFITDLTVRGKAALMALGIQWATASLSASLGKV